MKRNNTQRSGIFTLVISILVFLALIIGAAYAIVGSQITYDDSNITATLGTRPIFVSDASNQIVINIPYIPVTSENEYVISTGEGTVNVSLTTDYSTSTKCTYDIMWVWDETTVTDNQYIKTSGATKEYTISGTSSSDSFSEVQLNNYDSNNLKTKLHTGSIVANGGVLATDAWTLTANFYKTQAGQTPHRGANYTGKIVVENVVCENWVGVTLSNTILELADGSERESSQTNGGVYRVINPEVNVPSPTTYTKLTQSEYGAVTEYQGTTESTLPSSGTTLSEIMFDYNSSDNTYSNDVTNMATSSYYHMVVPVEENASYQICYKVTTAGATNYLYAYITDATSSYSGYLKLSNDLNSVGTTYTCTDLGYLKEGQGIRIVNGTYTTKAAVTFYLQKSTEMTLNGNAGVRYQGKDPNNYVQFNGTELWRIIGVFEGSTIGLEEGKYYTKIIKNESIGNKYWNETNEENNWANASLNTYLTNTYLPSIETSSSDMIAQDVTYYLGGSPSTAYTTYIPAQFYQAERGNVGGGAAPTVVTHQNEIGLMYPSDYGYAMYAGSSNNVCNTDLVIYNYSTSYLKCANYDWMFLNTDEWTISPHADNSSFVFRVYSGGYVHGGGVGKYELAVRPVLYLESDVYIDSGDGTLNNPFKLSKRS